MRARCELTTSELPRFLPVCGCATRTACGRSTTRRPPTIRNAAISSPTISMTAIRRVPDDMRFRPVVSIYGDTRSTAASPYRLDAREEVDGKRSQRKRQACSPSAASPGQAWPDHRRKTGSRTCSWRGPLLEPALTNEESDPRDEWELKENAGNDEPNSRCRRMTQPVVDVIAQAADEEREAEHRECTKREKSSADPTVKCRREISEKIVEHVVTS